MRLVISNIKNLFRYKPAFAVMIILTVTLGSFSLCFSIGILHNNKYASMEDELSTLQVHISFKEGVTYKEHEDAFKELFDIYGNAARSISVGHTAYQKDGEVYFCSEFVFKNGRYAADDMLKGFVAAQVVEGRNLDDDDFEKGNAVALMLKQFKTESIEFGDMTYEVVGLRDTEKNVVAESTVILPVSAWGNNPIDFAYFTLTRLPYEKEHEKMIRLLEKNFPESYELIDFYDKKVDLKPLYRTIRVAIVGIIIVTIVTMAFLLGYIYENRRYQLLVFRLVGCKSKRVLGYFLTEALILTVPFVVLGEWIFYMLKKHLLDRYYVYINEIFGAGLYVRIALAFIIVIVSLFFVLSIRLLVKPIKNEMTEVKR